MDCYLNRVVFFIRKKISGIQYDLPPKHSLSVVLKQNIKTVIQSTLII